jgi:hypothetical protein
MKNIKDAMIAETAIYRAAKERIDRKDGGFSLCSLRALAANPFLILLLSFPERFGLDLSASGMGG